MRSSREDVEAFLNDLFDGIECKNCVCKDRKKNMDTLAVLGWKWQDAIDEISTLTFRDYICGPEIDYDFPHDDDFWVFKRQINGQLVYIKLKIKYLEDKSVLVWSFHFDEV